MLHSCSRTVNGSRFSSAPVSAEAKSAKTRSEMCSWICATVTGKWQNNSLSETEVWSFRNPAFCAAELDAEGTAAPPRCVCRKDRVTGYLCRVSTHIPHTPEKRLSSSSNSVLRSPIPCPSRLLRHSLTAALQPPRPGGPAHLLPQGRAVRAGWFGSLWSHSLPSYPQRTKACFGCAIKLLCNGSET